MSQEPSHNWTKPTYEEFMKQGMQIYEKLTATPFLASRMPPRELYEAQLEEQWARVEPMQQEEFEMYARIQHHSASGLLKSLEKGMSTALQNREAYLQQLSRPKRIALWFQALWARLKSRFRRK